MNNNPKNPRGRAWFLWVVLSVMSLIPVGEPEAARGGGRGGARYGGGRVGGGGARYGGEKGRLNGSRHRRDDYDWHRREDVTIVGGYSSRIDIDPDDEFGITIDNGGYGNGGYGEVVVGRGVYNNHGGRHIGGGGRRR